MSDRERAMGWMMRQYGQTIVEHTEGDVQYEALWDVLQGVRMVRIQVTEAGSDDSDVIWLPVDVFDAIHTRLIATGAFQ